MVCTHFRHNLQQFKSIWSVITRVCDCNRGSYHLFTWETPSTHCSDSRSKWMCFPFAHRCWWPSIRITRKGRNTFRVMLSEGIFGTGKEKCHTSFLPLCCLFLKTVCSTSISGHNLYCPLWSEALTPWGHTGQAWRAIPVYLRSRLFSSSAELYNRFGPLLLIPSQKPWQMLNGSPKEHTLIICALLNMHSEQNWLHSVLISYQWPVLEQMSTIPSSPWVP